MRYVVSVVLVVCALATTTLAQCLHGSDATGLCVCTPGWMGDQCDIPVQAETCKDFKTLTNVTKDGEYILYKKTDSAKISYTVWCRGMNTTSPKEYISLLAGRSTNFASRYKYQLRQVGGITPPCNWNMLHDTWDLYGTTEYDRVRFDPTTMEVYLNDTTFADAHKRPPVPFGTAEDCLSAAVSGRPCDPKGEAQINLNHSPFVFASGTKDNWVLTSSKAKMDVRISSDNKYAKIICGGAPECGGCKLNKLVLDFDEENNPCVNNPCQNDGFCVETSESDSGYVCECKAGWSGPLCTVRCLDSFDCLPKCECQNGGVCNEYTQECECPYGWTGSECQEYDFCTVLSDGSDDPVCGNEGTCSNLVFDVVETNRGPCVFPFTYKNQTYDTCVVENGSRPWCSLTKNYDADGQRGDCIIHAVKPTPQGSSAPSPIPNVDEDECLVKSEFTGDATLSCADRPNQVISEIVFASFGLPAGKCGSFEISDACHTTGTRAKIEPLCLGKRSCIVPVSSNFFGSPCSTTPRFLAVQYKCGFAKGGEWVRLTSAYLKANNLVSFDVTGGCNDTVTPVGEWGGSTGANMAFHRFFPCPAGSKGIVKALITTPFMFTKVRGGFTGRTFSNGTIDDTAKCTDCAPGDYYGHEGNHVLFGSATKLIKMGGDWGTVTDSKAFGVPQTEFTATNALIFEVSSDVESTNFILVNVNLEIWVPFDKDYNAEVAYFSFDGLFDTSVGDVFPDRPTGSAGATLKMNCQGHCPSWEEYGLQGGALSFPPYSATSVSNFYFAAPSSSQLKVASGSWTVAVWVKPHYSTCPSSPNSPCHQPILCAAPSNKGSFCLFINGPSKAPIILMNSLEYTAPFRIAENEWTHLAWAYDDDAKVIRVSVNSETEVLKATSVFRGTDVPMTFGKMTYRSRDLFFRGEMDELHVYDRALNDHEIDDLAGIEPEIVPVVRMSFEHVFTSNPGSVTGKPGSDSLTLPTFTSVNPKDSSDLGGVIGYGAVYDGLKSCLDLGTAQLVGIDFRHTWTASIWVNPVGISSRPMPILMVGNTDRPTILNFGIVNGGLSLQIGSAGIRFVDNRKLIANTWNHVALRFQRLEQKVTLFLNGTGNTFKADMSAIDRVYDNVAKVDASIGCSPFGVSYFFNGVIDEVELFDHALSDDDVAKLAATIVADSIPASDADCDFDDNACFWNDASDSPIWKRWKGATPIINQGPLDDHTNGDTIDNRVICPATGHSYEYVSVGRWLTLPDAQKRAAAAGGYLATITSAEEQACITALTDQTVWIGGSDQAVEGSWIWVNGPEAGTPFSFKNWALGEPSQAGDDWLGMNWPGQPRGSWHSCGPRCTYQKGYIVEYEDKPGIFYTSNFASGIDGWTSNVKNLGTTKCGRFGTILGGPGIFGGFSYTEKVLNNLPVHHGLRVSLTFVAADDWEKYEYGYILVDDQEVWRWSPRANPSVWASSSSEECGKSKSGSVENREQAKVASIYIPSHVSSSVKIRVSTNLNENSKDESFGITDVRVYLEHAPDNGPCDDAENADSEPCYMYTPLSANVTSGVLQSPLLLPPADPDTCQLSLWYNMRGERWTSAKSCDELKWPYAKDLAQNKPWTMGDGLGDVCAASYLKQGCVDFVDYSTAEAICIANDARLCTVSEIQGNVGTDTGCQHDGQRLWTSTECGYESVYTTGSNGVETRCTSKSDPLAKLRCCADRVPDQSAGVLSVFVTEYRASPLRVFNRRGGGDDWVNAKIPLQLSRDIPFSVAITTQTGVNSSSVIAIDDISFEGCDPDSSKIVREYKNIDVVVAGNITNAALIASSWLVDTVADCIVAVSNPSLIYAGDDSTGVTNLDVSSDAKLDLGQSDFYSRMELSLDGVTGPSSLVFEGGSLDGVFVVDQSTYAFAGLLFGASAAGQTVSNLSHPLYPPNTKVVLEVERRGSMLIFSAQNLVLHVFSIGDSSLHTIGWKGAKQSRLYSWAVRVVISEDDGDDGGSLSQVRVADVYVAYGIDDVAEIKVPGSMSGPVNFNQDTLDLTKTIVPGSQPPVSTTQEVALRFRRIPVSRDNFVINAYVQFTSRQNSGNGFPTLTISGELSARSQPFVDLTVGPPMKLDARSQRKYYLSSAFSSDAACKFLGLSYTAGNPRVDSRIAACNYWSVDGTLVSQSCDTSFAYIQYLACDARGETIDDGAVSSRNRTTATASWRPSAWLEDERDTQEQTVDISDIINEIIKLPNWRAGSTITLFFSGITDAISFRAAYSLESAQSTGRTDAAAMLHIEYADAEMNPDQDLEATCSFPFTWKGKDYYECTAAPNPRQKDGEISKPWCGIGNTVDQNNFGFCTSHVVSTFGGNDGDNNHCAFPFVYRGRTFTDCVSFTDGGRTGAPWCATTVDYDDDGLWGYCDIPTYGGSAGGAPCVFPFWFGGKQYFECTTDGNRGADQAWCITMPTTSDYHGVADWGFCSRGSDTVESWGFQCDCPAGWTGTQCERPCSSGTFGENCLSTCTCQNGGQCDPVTGVCTCLPGWGGDNCETPNQSGFDCSVCTNEIGGDDVCNPSESDPHCHCAPGWAAPFCEQGCASGSWGAGCQNTCDCNGADCDPFVGTCVSCPPGYTGPNCRTQCPQGRFGASCSETCRCFNGATCDPFNGRCTCAQGWFGPTCSQRAGPIVNTGVAWINEFHYDSVGKDNSEFVEIAGVAGLNLSNWYLELYTGRSGQGQMYKRVPLSGVIPNIQAGYGMISFSFPPGTLENGNTALGSGMALINPQQLVTQFISYEGEFQAASGTARGLKSTDIGVFEPPNTRPDYSLQLRGSGSRYEHFRWTPVPLPSTPNALNRGQMFEADSQSIVRVDLGLVLGKGRPSSLLSSLLSSSSSQDDIANGILDALRRVTLKEEHVNNLRIILASPGNGIAVTFQVAATADDLPPTSHIVTALVQKNVIFVSGTALSISNVGPLTGCLPGTVFGPDGLCVAEVVSTTSTQSTSRTTTTSTKSTTRTTTKASGSTTSSSGSSTASSSSTTARPVDCGSFGCCPDGKTPKASKSDVCSGNSGSSKKGSKVSKGGVAAGIIVIVVIAAAVAFFIYKKRTNKVNYMQLQVIHEVESEEGDDGDLPTFARRLDSPALDDGIANHNFTFKGLQGKEEEEDDAMLDLSGDLATFTQTD